jgi:hypothetical protein
MLRWLVSRITGIVSKGFGIIGRVRCVLIVYSWRLGLLLRRQIFMQSKVGFRWSITRGRKVHLGHTGWGIGGSIILGIIFLPLLV